MSTIDALLDATNNLHQPLTVTPAASLEVQDGQIATLAHQTITATASTPWRHHKRGAMTPTATGFTLTAPARYATWAPGDPADGDYVGYGETVASLDLPRADWTGFNQLAITLESHCTNLVNPDIIFHYRNEGAQPIPDRYDREGHHVINLFPGRHTYLLNLTGTPRDAVTAISFSYEINGSVRDLPGEYRVTLHALTLQRVAAAVTTHGWTPNTISYSHDGYLAAEDKVAVLPADISGDFRVLDDATGAVVLAGAVRAVTTTTGRYGLADFSAVTTPGRYRLTYPGGTTPRFTIGSAQAVWGASVPKVLNFIYSERCGYPVPGIHGGCHEDVTATHDGRQISFNGGWHDAGDLSQQLIHTAEATQALFDSAAQVAASEPRLAARLREEGEWGLDFIFKTDFGHGYHATSAGVSRWTDNQRGTMDDAAARVHNSAYDNYLLAAILGRIAQTLAPGAERDQVCHAARADFDAAEKVFAAHPYAQEPIFWEHTLNTSEASYDATVVKAAATLFALTQVPAYCERATAAMTRLLTAQEQVGLTMADGTVVRGVFYRDHTHRVFQHFNHQARESLFAEAFAAALTLPVAAPVRAAWAEAARNYGDYLLWLRQFTAPYPMIASGLYRDDEAADTASWDLQHLLVDDQAKRDYPAQLAAGVAVAPHLTVRRFPVWFSFRGNNGVALATGQSAAIMAQVLNDPALRALANAQLRWVVGNNPFDQSLMYGEGHHCHSQYTNSSGEMIGELPVGIQTRDNEDVPYWPQFNNATYKEVWIVSATKWLAIVTQLFATESTPAAQAPVNEFTMKEGNL